MLGTYMPEAAINKDGEAPFREDDVWPGPSGPTDVDGTILAEPISTSMKEAPYGFLRRCVCSPISSHDC